MQEGKTRLGMGGRGALSVGVARRLLDVACCPPAVASWLRCTSRRTRRRASAPSRRRSPAIEHTQTRSTAHPSSVRAIQAWYCDGLAGAHAQGRRGPCAACGTAGRLLHAPVVLHAGRFALHAGCFALHAVVSRCTLRGSRLPRVGELAHAEDRRVVVAGRPHAGGRHRAQQRAQIRHLRPFPLRPRSPRPIPTSRPRRPGRCARQ